MCAPLGHRGGGVGLGGDGAGGGARSGNGCGAGGRRPHNTHARLLAATSIASTSAATSAVTTGDRPRRKPRLTKEARGDDVGMELARDLVDAKLDVPPPETDEVFIAVRPGSRILSARCLEDRAQSQSKGFHLEI